METRVEPINKVLVADDSPIPQKTLTVYLKIYNPVLVLDGVQALQAVIPDIDLNDPRFNFTEVTQWIGNNLDKDPVFKLLPIEQIIDQIHHQFPDLRISGTRYNKYNAIVMDDLMPHLRGSVATILIRFYENQNAIPHDQRNFIITCSDSLKNEKGEPIKAPGADTVTPKQPIKRELVISAVRSSPYIKDIMAISDLSETTSVESANMKTTSAGSKRPVNSINSTEELGTKPGSILTKKPKFFGDNPTNEKKALEEDVAKQSTPLDQQNKKFS